MLQDKKYSDLKDGDKWITDGFNCDDITLCGKSAIVVDGEPVFFVDASTLPDNYLEN